ncbi:MAG: histidine phosphatase family protein [Usitatibacteraceae bacterium]
MMRSAVLLLLYLLAQQASANDLLWDKLRIETDLVVLMRHTQPAGGNPLVWDESGSCTGESMLTVEGKAHARKIGEAFAKHAIKPFVISSPMCRCRDTARIAFGEALVTDAALWEIATADRERTSAFERKAQSLIASRRGSTPLVFVSHRPNIDLLSLELIGEGELLVARANENGELTVLGKMQVRP